MKINNRKELQNITINHSADSYYKDLVKIYKKCTIEPYSFLTIDTTLPASDPLTFRKTYFLLIKMTVTDQIKVLDRKIMQNEAQYDLDREAAKTESQSIEIDGRNFYDQAINDLIKPYDEVRKILAGQCNRYKTGYLFDFAYFEKNYRLIVADLSKKKALDTDSRAVVQ